MDRRWSCSRVAAAVAVVALLVCQTGTPTIAGQWDEAPGSPHGSVTVPHGSFEDDLRATEEFLASRPLFEQPMGSGLGDVEGLTDISAASCGECHQAIAAEWRQSTHALAWVDRQFQAEISKSDNRWLCVNCHTPLLRQQEQWAVGLVEGDVEAPILVTNQQFDSNLQKEGITCAACHLRDGVIVGPGVGGKAPHPVRAEPEFTNDELCLRCHQATAVYPGKSFICTFTTGEEWREGPYSKAGTGCTDCHMPRVSRPIVEGGPIRQVAMHGWGGSGIAKVAGIDKPKPDMMGLDLVTVVEGDRLQVTATNARAGHQLPTGDPERWVQIDVRFLSGDGAEVGEIWQQRIGQVWSWNPQPKRLSDNRLKPTESRHFQIDIPPQATTAMVTASSHRMKPEIAEYHQLGDHYPLSVETHDILVKIR